MLMYLLYHAQVYGEAHWINRIFQHGGAIVILHAVALRRRLMSALIGHIPMSVRACLHSQTSASLFCFTALEITRYRRSLKSSRSLCKRLRFDKIHENLASCSLCNRLCKRHCSGDGVAALSVRRRFAHFQERHRLGRLLAQIAYYFAFFGRCSRKSFN